MSSEAKVYLIDDDVEVRKLLTTSLTFHDFSVESFDSAEAFLDNVDNDIAGCIVLDLQMPGMSGLELQHALNNMSAHPPIIFVTGHGDVAQSVEALKAGAFDFLEKPFSQEKLVATIQQAFEKDVANRHDRALRIECRSRFDKLTPRESEIMKMLISGSANHSSKAIASELEISPRTIEHHRTRILEKTEAHSVAELVKFAAIAGIESE